METLKEPKARYSVLEGCEGQQVYCSEGIIVLTDKTPQKSLKYLFDVIKHPSVEYK
tara:strand:- start:2317 stop:2484 length:168 start_codon:yes stop_codon:yes gene_type:complete